MRWLTILVLCGWLLMSTGCAWMGPWSPLRSLEHRALFHPEKYPLGDWNPTTAVIEDANFTASDGTKLHGWYVAHEQPRGVALLCHGNAGNVTSLAETLRILNRRHGLAVLALDYRGYGKSEGKPSEEGILRDARAARAWLAKKTNLAETDIILMGQSLGGAVAIDLAQDGARGLVVNGTFTSVAAVAREHSPLFPVNWFMSMRLDSLSNIKKYHGPVLISHGEADEVVPFHHAEELLAAAPGKKQLVKLPGARHNDGVTEEYRAALDQFIADLPPTSSLLSTAAAGTVRKHQDDE